MKHVVLSFLVLVGIQIYASTGSQTIRGKIVDKDSKIPLIGATVVIIESDPIVGTVTGIDGEFRLENITLGRQSLKISYVGYNDAFVNNLLLNVGKEVVLNIELVEKVTELEEVVVKAFERKDKTINEMAMVSARSFTIEETERFAGSLGDPARMVANYAGVMTQNDSRNDIIIRGNSPIGVLWRVDDIEIPNPNHFNALGTTGGPISMINNNLLTNSDFLTGAFPAEYGNAISGAFDLNLRSGNNEKNEYVGQIGFNGFEFGAEGPISKSKQSSYLINYRYSVLAIMHELGFGTGTGSAVPYYQDLTFKVNFPKTKIGRVSLFGIGGLSKISLEADTAGSAYNTTFTNTYYAADLGTIGLSHLVFFNDKTRLKTTLSAYGTKNTTEVDSIVDIKTNKSNDYYRSHYLDGKVSVSTVLKSKINNRNNFSTGLTYDHYLANYTDSVFVRDLPVGMNGDSMEYADKFLTITDGEGKFPLIRAFGQWQHKLNDNLSFYTGLYAQYFDFTNDFVLEPRLAMNWQVFPGHNINVGFGKHSMIQPRQTYFQQYHDTITDTYHLSNDYIGFSKSDHYVIGYNYLINKNFRLKLESYYQHLYDIPVHKEDTIYSMANQGDFFGIYTPDSMVNKGTGRNYGMEFTLEKFLSKGYYFLFTASLFDSKYKGYDGVFRNTSFNGNYVFNLLGGYEKKVGRNNRLTFDVKAVWAGGKRYTPFSPKIYNLVALGENIKQDQKITVDDIEYDDSKAFAKKYNDYFRIDFRIGLKLNHRKYSEEWAIDFQNLTGYKSIFSEQYDPGRNEIVTTYQQGFYPMFLWRVYF